MRSTTCRGSNNQFLEEYHSLVAAEMAAEETKKNYGHTLTPAKCRACGYWHLTTVTTRRQCMFCTDRALFLKDIYSTREEAQRTAEHLRKEKKVMLLPYKCPHGNGWHLTKKWKMKNEKWRMKNKKAKEAEGAKEAKKHAIPILIKDRWLQIIDPSAVGTTDFVKWGFNPAKKGEGWGNVTCN